MAEDVCAEVPHRRFVFTIPKRIRIYFRFDRRQLGELCQAAARTVITVHQAVSGRPDTVPGMMGTLQMLDKLSRRSAKILRHRQPSHPSPPHADNS